ncbi:hypothetical protein SAMN05421788_11071 [Filimonas lacunae]|uniref:Auto-transporter adhesin head GIN domain-containing protein n=1 Tax=Filimonas lacunae TaxID=477680 RepID=A0A173M9X4_9BACT|nr:hypothetical protein [Filimonas lacunae]BAV04343.1 hypothetical protein FLA_0331 [Filimonas lacunae]SIT31079.1 hypothetical protein SAMN05421788_11071 [Filimonas lacunae]
MKKALILSGMCLLAGVASHAQYHISTDNLVKQFLTASTEQHIFVKGTDLKQVICLNKSEAIDSLEVTNLTAIRIYKKDNSKTTFYFNTIKLTDSTITGCKTHFFNSYIKPIALTDIERIEIMR